MIPDLLLLSGRSGVGKTTVAYEVSARLAAAEVAHWHLEGDLLDAVHPKPADDPDGSRLTRANLAALWANIRALGVHRVLYVNSAAVLEAAELAAGLGPPVRTTLVELTAEDATAAARLAARERGSGLAEHLGRSARMARLLAERAPAGVHRVRTDGREVAGIAAEVVELSGWSAPTPLP